MRFIFPPPMRNPVVAPPMVSKVVGKANKNDRNRRK